MQPPCLGACGGGGGLALPVPRRRASSSCARPPRAPASCSAGGGKASSSRGKDNVWSVDNERAAAKGARSTKHRRRRRPDGRCPPPPGERKEKDAGSRVLVSGAMLVEVESVLHTQLKWHMEGCWSRLLANHSRDGAYWSWGAKRHTFRIATFFPTLRSLVIVVIGPRSEGRQIEFWSILLGKLRNRSQHMIVGVTMPQVGRELLICLHMNLLILRGVMYLTKKLLLWSQESCFLSDTPFVLKPFSQRSRTRPSELTGSWKVYEVSATPIFSDEMREIEGGARFVYLCMETMKKRTLPESSVFFGEEEMLDMQDVTVLWLPGGVTAYVDIDKDGVLCIGVGWYSEEGINLVMERDWHRREAQRGSNEN